jgi:hypothetical protein
MQASAVLNHWIVGILNYDFQIVHVPAHKHQGPDALSKRPHTIEEEDNIQESDPDDWIDQIALATRIQPSILESNSLDQPRPHQQTISSAKFPA